MPLSLSAADWTRLKRLQGAKKYKDDIANNYDVTNVVVKADPFSPPRLISRDVGSSKIRRPGSFWTDSKASERTDFVLKNETTGLTPQLKKTEICGCTTTTLNPRTTGCLNCRLNGKQHLRM